MSAIPVSDAFMRALPGFKERAAAGSGIGATRPATQPHINQAAHRAVNRVISSSTRKRPTSEERAKEVSRRRKWGGGGNMPEDVREYYTEGERAALSVIADRCKSRGFCDMTVPEIARVAGVGHTTVQNAIRKARSKECSHISVRERPQAGGKNLPNIIKIICSSWLGWIKRAIGFKRLNTSETTVKNSLSLGAETSQLALERKGAVAVADKRPAVAKLENHSPPAFDLSAQRIAWGR